MKVKINENEFEVSFVFVFSIFLSFWIISFRSMVGCRDTCQICVQILFAEEVNIHNVFTKV